jgi:hypothetical protein
MRRKILSFLKISNEKQLNDLISEKNDLIASVNSIALNIFLKKFKHL